MTIKKILPMLLISFFITRAATVSVFAAEKRVEPLNLKQTIQKAIAANLGLQSGRPTVVQIGSQDFAAYELTLSTKVVP